MLVLESRIRSTQIGQQLWFGMSQRDWMSFVAESTWQMVSLRAVEVAAQLQVLRRSCEAHRRGDDDGDVDPGEAFYQRMLEFGKQAGIWARVFVARNRWFSRDVR